MGEVECVALADLVVKIGCKMELGGCVYGRGGEKEEEWRRGIANVGGSHGGRRGEGVVMRKITKMSLPLSFFSFLFQAA